MRGAEESKVIYIQEEYGLKEEEIKIVEEKDNKNTLFE